MAISTDRRPIGFWLKLVDRLIDERLEALGDLSRRHWQVLNVVQQGPTTQSEIDARVRPFLDQGETTVREVSDLQQRGWLTVSSDTVALTELGTREFERLLDAVLADRAALMTGITPDQYAGVVATLEVMARNLGWLPPTPHGRA